METIRLRIFNKEIYENLNNVAPDNFLGGAYASTGAITLASQQKETAYYTTRQKKNSGKPKSTIIGYKTDNPPTDINNPQHRQTTQKKK